MLELVAHVEVVRNLYIQRTLHILLLFIVEKKANLQYPVIHTF